MYRLFMIYNKYHNNFITLLSTMIRNYDDNDSLIHNSISNNSYYYKDLRNVT